MNQHIVYFALGSNLGDRLENLRSARRAISLSVKLNTCSSIYETPPWGFTEQPLFYNQIVQGVTELTPRDLFLTIKKIEKDLGRTPSFHNGPRLIDIDILFYDDLVLETPELILPHPRMEGRAFIWLPLAEISPQRIHPVFGKSVAEIASQFDKNQIKRIAGPECD